MPASPARVGDRRRAPPDHGRACAFDSEPHEEVVQAFRCRAAGRRNRVNVGAESRHHRVYLGAPRQKVWRRARFAAYGVLNHECQETGVVDRLHGGGRAFLQSDGLGSRSSWNQQRSLVEDDGAPGQAPGNHPLGKRKIVGHADIDEGGVVDTAKKATVGGDLRIDVGLDRDRAGPHALDDTPRKDPNPAIDQSGRRRGGPLAEARDSRAVHQHLTVARNVLHAADCQGRLSVGRGRGQIPQVDVEQRVAVEEEEAVVEMVARETEGAAGSERLRLDEDAKVRRLAEYLAQPFPAEAGQQNQIRQTVAPKLVKEPRQEGPSADVQERLGHDPRSRA